MSVKTWAIIAQKGGSGKTTLALHLAIIAQSEGRRIVVIDVDPQQSAMRWGRIRGTDSPKVTSSIVSELPRLLNRFRQDQYDLAIIDTSPRADRDSIEVAGLADLIIVPMRPSILDLPAIEDTLRIVQSANRMDQTVIVMNSVAPRTDEGDEAARIVGKMGTLNPNRLGERVDFRRALTGGRGVTEFSPSSKASEEVKALYESLKGY